MRLFSPLLTLTASLALTAAPLAAQTTTGLNDLTGGIAVLDRYAGFSLNTDLAGVTVSSVDQALFTSSGGADLTLAAGTDITLDSPVVNGPANFRPIAVPEPASMLLMGTGLAAVAGWRKRRRA